MNKILVGISGRQETVFRGLSQSLDITLSELVRRALDHYIDTYVIDNYTAQSDSTLLVGAMRVLMPMPFLDQTRTWDGTCLTLTTPV